jgi:hypothetical protein
VTASTVDMGAMLFWLALAAWSRDRWYDFLNIFVEKNSVFYSKQS